MAAALKGVLAQDAKLEDVLKTLMALDAEKEDMPKAKAEDEEEDDKEEAKEKAMDADEEEDKKKAEDGDEYDDGAMDAEEEMVSKKPWTPLSRPTPPPSKPRPSSASTPLHRLAKLLRLMSLASGRIRQRRCCLPCRSDGHGHGRFDVKEVAALEIILKSQPLPVPQRQRRPPLPWMPKPLMGFFELFPNAPRSVKSL